MANTVLAKPMIDKRSEYPSLLYLFDQLRTMLIVYNKTNIYPSSILIDYLQVYKLY
jgi:hypothetical protein